MPKQKYNRILTVDCAQNTASQIRHCCRDLYVDFRDYPCADETISVTRANDWDLLIINPESNASMAMDICTTARSVKPLSQIIVVSKDCNDAVIAQWLSHGADDCIATPFSPIEFTARVSAALRRSNELHIVNNTQRTTPDAKSAIAPKVAASITIHRESKEVDISGTTISLTRTELLLLSYLADNTGRPCSKLELLKQVLGYDDECYLPTLYTHMNRLRSKLKQQKIASPYIATVWRFGYKLVFDR